MEGDDQVRYCRTCGKNVYDTRTLVGTEAERLLALHEGDSAVRLTARADGTAVAGSGPSCTAGLRASCRRGRARCAMLAAAAAALVALAFVVVDTSKRIEPPGPVRRPPPAAAPVGARWIDPVELGAPPEPYERCAVIGVSILASNEEEFRRQFAELLRSRGCGHLVRRLDERQH